MNLPEEIKAQYEVLENIGSQESNIYLVKSLQDGELYAIKELLLPYYSEKPKVQKIVQEVLKAGERFLYLDHPQIPRFTKFIPLDGKYYFIMEYIDGQNVDILLEKADDFLSCRQVAVWAIQICNAFMYLHSRHIVFRDLKPEHIIIDRTGNVKLVDFGLSKYTSINVRSLKIYPEVTPYFSSPEQVQKQPNTFLSDIYSLGANLYFILTESFPADARERIKAGELLENPSRLNSHIPDDLDYIIMRAMAIEPAARYPNIEAMKIDLETFLEGKEVLRETDTLSSSSVEKNVSSFNNADVGEVSRWGKLKENSEDKGLEGKKVKIKKKGGFLRPRSGLLQPLAGAEESSGEKQSYLRPRSGMLEFDNNLNARNTGGTFLRPRSGLLEPEGLSSSIPPETSYRENREEILADSEYFIPLPEKKEKRSSRVTSGFLQRDPLPANDDFVPPSPPGLLDREKEDSLSAPPRFPGRKKDDRSSPAPPRFPGRKKDITPSSYVSERKEEKEFFSGDDERAIETFSSSSLLKDEEDDFLSPVPQGLSENEERIPFNKGSSKPTNLFRKEVLEEDFIPPSPPGYAGRAEEDFIPPSPPGYAGRAEEDFIPPSPPGYAGRAEEDFIPPSPPGYPGRAEEDFIPPSPPGYPGRAEEDFIPPSPPGYAGRAEEDFIPPSPPGYAGRAEEDFIPPSPPGYPGRAEEDFIPPSPPGYAGRAEEDFIPPSPPGYAGRAEEDFIPPSPPGYAGRAEEDFIPPSPPGYPGRAEEDFIPPSPPGYPGREEHMPFDRSSSKSTNLFRRDSLLEDEEEDFISPSSPKFQDPAASIGFFGRELSEKEDRYSQGSGFSDRREERLPFDRNSSKPTNLFRRDSLLRDEEEEFLPPSPPGYPDEREEESFNPPSSPRFPDPAASIGFFGRDLSEKEERYNRRPGFSNREERIPFDRGPSKPTNLFRKKSPLEVKEDEEIASFEYSKEEGFPDGDYSEDRFDLPSPRTALKREELVSRIDEEFSAKPLFSRRKENINETKRENISESETYSPRHLLHSKSERINSEDTENINTDVKDNTLFRPDLLQAGKVKEEAAKENDFQDHFKGLIKGRGLKSDGEIEKEEDNLPLSPVLELLEAGGPEDEDILIEVMDDKALPEEKPYKVNTFSNGESYPVLPEEEPQKSSKTGFILVNIIAFICIAALFYFLVGRQIIADLYFTRGKELVISQTRPEEAIRLINKSAEFKKDTFEYNFYMGKAYLLKEDYSPAIDFLNKALELEGEKAKIYEDLGDIYVRMEDYKNAAYNYEKLLDYTIDDASIYLKLGDLYKAVPDYEKSITYYNEYLKYTEGDYRVRMILAEFYQTSGDVDRAAEEMEKALISMANDKEIPPEELSRAFLYSGYLYFKKGDYSSSINYYMKAFCINPYLEVNQSPFNDMAKHFKGKVNKNKKDFEAGASLACIYFIQGKIDEGTKIYNTTLKDAIKSSEKSLFCRAMIYYRKEDINNAHKLLSEYLKLYPDGMFKKEAEFLLGNNKN